MTFAEAERFYEQDTRKYEIIENEEFLKWLENKISNGYHGFITTVELQKLIDNIVNWYEIKYPERELELFEGTRYTNFQNIKSISDVMDFRQLLYRLPHKQLCLMECGYRAQNWVDYSFYENGKRISEPCIVININKKDDSNRDLAVNYFPIYAVHRTGKVLKDEDLEILLGDDDYYLDELLTALNDKYENVFNLTELKASVYDHNVDIELRNRILELAALKLLYSERTIPERGYGRAKRLISEMNKQHGINLSSKAIDEIMNRDYKYERSFFYTMVKNLNQGRKLSNAKKTLKNILKSKN